MEALLGFLIPLVENGYVPDFLLRVGCKHLLQSRIDQIPRDPFTVQRDKQNFIRELKEEAIALSTQEANEQHYEVPSEFFKMVLDQKYLKYSCCYFGFEGPQTKMLHTTLEEASDAMMLKYVERAELIDGMSLLDLGCGWGSLSLFLGKTFPGSKITSVSNSKTQKEYIEEQCRIRDIKNITVITADANFLELGQNQFDRVLSIEMFEHMKNYKVLLKRISNWLKPKGKLFPVPTNSFKGIFNLFRSFFLQNFPFLHFSSRT